VTLSATNSYSGDTRVTAGTLSLSSASLANGADVFLSTGSTLDLDFAGTDVIDSLLFNGAPQATGLWGAVGSGAPFESAFLTGTGRLQVTSAPMFTPGDFDKNGVVNAADLAQWRGDFGLNGDSDADNDGDSDGNDFLIWQRNLGANAAVAATGAVPEPAAAAISLIGVVALTAAARRRRATTASSPLA
jgi:autotransporter-associated beta strand protein